MSPSRILGIIAGSISGLLAVWGLILGGVLAVFATALLTWAARSRVATPA